MSKSQEKDQNNAERKPPARSAFPPAWILVVFLVVATSLLLIQGQGDKRDEITQTHFERQIAQKRVDQPVEIVGKVKIRGSFIKDGSGRYPYKEKVRDEDGKLNVPKKGGEPEELREDFYVTLSGSDQDIDYFTKLLRKNNLSIKNVVEQDSSQMLMFLISVGLPILLIVFIFLMLRRTRDQLMGGGFLSGFSKSPAKEYEEDQDQITFADVAGLGSVKLDLQEIIEFLKNPAKFQRLGGRIPKGVLLMGPPGTGKTLLARAIAGEAGVPFYSVNGSEFIQMFVGVGASRVRDLFSKAKENAPGIIFIDEIDAVGRQRGAGLGGGHDEREQTLNQILSEMDGFDPAESVIVVAATNRPDVLDPALLRPGRFDRHITVDRPTLKGRIEMYKVHVRDVPLADDVDIKRLAEGSVGLTGADIRNLVNEAALWATRQDKKAVGMDDFEYARDKVLMGAKREEVLIGEEKEKTAYHEAGHALVAWLTDGMDRVHKVTVIPRGRALGVTQTLPEEDRMNIAESELEDRLAFMLGGRAAEKLVYHEHSAGAENDLERATGIARKMVTKWGMSETLGPVSYKLSDDDPFLGREIHQQRQFSEATMEKIDAEVASILNQASKRALQVLTENRDKLETLTEALVKEEELSEKDITELIGPSVHSNKEHRPSATTESIAAKDPMPQGEFSSQSSAGETD
jgi:cell division protease FtsH